MEPKPRHTTPGNWRTMRNMAGALRYLLWTVLMKSGYRTKNLLTCPDTAIGAASVAIPGPPELLNSQIT
jgi:hypothetical protein